MCGECLHVPLFLMTGTAKFVRPIFGPMILVMRNFPGDDFWKNDINSFIFWKMNIVFGPQFLEKSGKIK